MVKKFIEKILDERINNMSYFTVERCDKCGGVPIEKRRWWHGVAELCSGAHPKKVTELSQLKLEEVAFDDVILISDVSEQTSKKISMADIIEYVRRNQQ